MARPNRADAQLIRDITATLRTVVDGAPPVLAEVLPAIARLTSLEKAFAYGVEREGETFHLEWWHTSGVPHAAAHFFDAWLRQGRPFYALFDPDRPDPAQRNVALNLEGLEALTDVSKGLRTVKPVFSNAGVLGHDQLRVLVCDGPSLLGWVGGFRQERFTSREQRLLQALVPALRRRLCLDRLLATAPLDLAALAAVLEQVPAAALVVTAHPRLLHANTAGQALWDSDGRATLEDLRESIKTGGPQAPFEVTRLSSPGLPDHFLAVRRREANAIAPRLLSARARWGPTPKQAQVLALLARGQSNRTIAAELRCAESTVELHVTALLEKSGSESRAMLIARFWS
ncbi:MAG: helix-turn-helix domain-containing protein, partial [Myxococcaceae bacterium]